MLRDLSEPRKAAVLAAVVLVASAGLFAAAFAMTRPPGPGVVRDVGVRIEGPGWTLTYGTHATSNGTAFSLLLEAADRLGFDVGYRRFAPPLDSVLVTSINGSENGEGDLWWLYWVDGRYGEGGADRAVLAGGSDVLWAFRSYPPTGA